MNENCFVVIFKEKTEVKYQIVLAASAYDAQSTFKFEYLDKEYKILSLMSYDDILKKLDDLKGVYDDAKLIQNSKGQLIEIRPHHAQYEDTHQYLTKEQLKYSFVGLLELFKSNKENFLISSSIDVDWNE